MASIGTGAITADKLSAETIQSIVDAAVNAVKLLISGTAGIVPSMVTVSGGTLPIVSQLAGEAVKDFQIGKYEVTWGEWKAVRAWAVANGYSDLASVGAGHGNDYPVTDVSWYDVVKWCNAKSEMEGKTPVYKVSGATYKTAQSVPTTNEIANGYRLPNVAEWEWAARGGRLTQGYKFSGSDSVTAVAWTSENSSDGSKLVGTKVANELGLYDMSGNVSEWCWDLYGGTSLRRLRGGSFYFNADSSLVGFLNENALAGWYSSRDGFRVARNAAE